MNIEKIWQNVKVFEGETFYTVTGLKFTYKLIDNNTIRPFRNGSTKWDLSKNLFCKALSFPSYRGAKFNHTIIGSSYVRGILEDNRIMGK